MPVRMPPNLTVSWRGWLEGEGVMALPLRYFVTDFRLLVQHDKRRHQIVQPQPPATTHL